MIELPDEAATCTFAACLASEAVAGDIIGLSGTLGLEKPYLLALLLGH